MVRVKRAVQWSLMVLCGLLVVVVPLRFDPADVQRDVQAAGCWQAEITEQQINTELIGSVLRVSVQGKGGLPVLVRSRGDFQTIGFTGTKPEYGPWVAEFAPLSRGIYYVEPQGLGIVLEIWLDGQSYTRVDFTSLPCAPTPTPTQRLSTATPSFKVWPPSQPATATPLPPTPTRQPQPTQGWYGRVVEHRRNPDGGVNLATIAVRVIGRPAGQQVDIGSGGWSASAKTGTKPEHGPDACEFGGLRPGTYRLFPVDLAYLDVAVEQGDFVLVEFYPTGGVITRWAGSVVKNTSGDVPTGHANSAIAVVVAGRPWHEVEIRSDGWTAIARTGYKPEYGPDACEFGALRAGTYTVIPKGLGVSVQVAMDGWGWAMVLFEEFAVPQPQPASPQPQPTSRPTQAQPALSTPRPQPSPTPLGSGWQGQVISNTSGERPGSGVSSVIVVRVLNWRGVPVTITGGGGWSATCITGTKPEYGADACEFGGLWSGTYYLRPEGADAQVTVTMDGQGMAILQFTAP